MKNKKRLLIFHPYLATYRIDVYNRLAKDYEVKVILTGHPNEISGLGFNLEKINEQAQFDYHYYNKGRYIGRHLLSTIYFKAIKEFKPDVVVGTGGYVCGPVLLAAALMKVPTLIQEQNVIPGITNKILGKFVDAVAVGYQEAKQYFSAKKVFFTGNPCSGKGDCQSIGISSQSEATGLLRGPETG